MNNNVVTLQPRPAKPRLLGPVPALMESSRVLQGRANQSDVLEIRLNVRLDDVPKRQRRSLAALLHSTGWLNLTLTERETPEGGGAAA